MFDDDDDKPGYGKPPKSGQFKKGQSGNPRGRPKKSRNLTQILQDVADSTIEVRKDGKSVRLSRLEAMALQLAQKALAGDIRAFGQLVRYLKEHGVHTPEEPEGKYGVLVVNRPPLTLEEFQALYCNGGVPTREQIKLYQQGMNALCEELIENDQRREEEGERYRQKYGDKFKGFPGNRDPYAMLEGAGRKKL